MINLKCPHCGEESIISSKWNQWIDENDQECRFCDYQATTHDFIEAYNDIIEPEPGPDEEYDPCFENGRYY